MERNVDVRHEAWMDRASCRGANPGLFFPERHRSSIDIREAKAVCAVCPVRADCLDYALTNGEKFGVWGGLSPHDRRRLRRSRPAPVDRIPHGTESGYASRNYKCRCTECTAAHNRYNRDRYAARRQAATS